MSIKLVASDLDGTIIDRNNNIAPQNFEAIKKVLKKNIPFVVCTGKSYSVSKKICDQFHQIPYFSFPFCIFNKLLVTIAL